MMTCIGRGLDRKMHIAPITCSSAEFFCKRDRGYPNYYHTHSVMEIELYEAKWSTKSYVEKASQMSSKDLFLHVGTPTLQKC